MLILVFWPFKMVACLLVVCVRLKAANYCVYIETSILLIIHVYFYFLYFPVILLTLFGSTSWIWIFPPLFSNYQHITFFSRDFNRRAFHCCQLTV